jgi:alpha-beta hydrolase superfamily lysophospholipase
MGHTVLMIHGVGCDGASFSRMKGLMEARGLVCEAPTLFPEFRVRENPTGQLSTLTLHDYIEQASGWARDILRRTGRQPIVLGHSMGGLIAQKLAERGQASAAILFTPAQPVDCRVTSLKVLWTFANIVVQGKPERAYKVWKRGFVWGVLNRVDPVLHDGIYAQALYDSGMVYRDLGSPHLDPHHSCVVDEAKIRCPVLTIGATEDRATVIEAVRKVAAKYARIGGDYREYDRAAHWLIDEPRTGDVVADICDWIARKVED